MTIMRPYLEQELTSKQETLNTETDKIHQKKSRKDLITNAKQDGPYKTIKILIIKPNPIFDL